MNNQVCKYCQSERVIKYGKYKDVQRYFCKDCRRKFAGLDTIPKMQYSTSKVADALNMYYEGMSLNEIRRNFIQQHNDYISDVSALNWVNRFTKLAVMEADKYNPNVGDIWVADETMVDIDGKNIWFWDIIDTKTRFLIASHMSFTHTSRDAQTLMEQAYKITARMPVFKPQPKLAKPKRQPLKLKRKRKPKQKSIRHTAKPTVSLSRIRY